MFCSHVRRFLLQAFHVSKGTDDPIRALPEYFQHFISGIER